MARAQIQEGSLIVPQESLEGTPRRRKFQDRHSKESQAQEGEAKEEELDFRVVESKFVTPKVKEATKSSVKESLDRLGEWKFPQHKELGRSRPQSRRSRSVSPGSRPASVSSRAHLGLLEGASSTPEGNARPEFAMKCSSAGVMDPKSSSDAGSDAGIDRPQSAKEGTESRDVRGVEKMLRSNPESTVGSALQERLVAPEEVAGMDTDVPESLEVPPSRTIHAISLGKRRKSSIIQRDVLVQDHVRGVPDAISVKSLQATYDGVSPVRASSSERLKATLSSNSQDDRMLHRPSSSHIIAQQWELQSRKELGEIAQMTGTGSQEHAMHEVLRIREELSTVILLVTTQTQMMQKIQEHVHPTIEKDLNIMQRLERQISDEIDYKIRSGEAMRGGADVESLSRKLSELKEVMDEYQNLNEGQLCLGTIDYGKNDPYARLIYSGQIMDEMRHGLGVMLWRDGTRYEGHWLDDEANGLACETYSDGSDYKGQFCDGVRNGLGSVRKKGGDSFEVCLYMCELTRAFACLLM